MTVGPNVQRENMVFVEFIMPLTFYAFSSFGSAKLTPKSLPSGNQKLRAASCPNDGQLVGRAATLPAFWEKNLLRFTSTLNNVFPSTATSGGIAQLGEREHGMFEVAGSIPVTSTTF
jgi:hypothetical protein